MLLPGSTLAALSTSLWGERRGKPRIDVVAARFEASTLELVLHLHVSQQTSEEDTVVQDWNLRIPVDVEEDLAPLQSSNQTIASGAALNYRANIEEWWDLKDVSQYIAAMAERLPP